MRRAPVPHPVHGHAVQPVLGAELRQPRGLGMRRDEGVAFALHEPGELLAVDAGSPRIIHGGIYLRDLRAGLALALAVDLRAAGFTAVGFADSDLLSGFASVLASGLAADLASFLSS